MLQRGFRSAILIGVALLVLSVGNVVTLSASDADPAYRASFEQWKAYQVDDLKQNWLTLAGLFWLKPGVTTFGSDPENDIVLPQGTSPAHAGTFEFDSSGVTAKFLPGVSAVIGGKSASSSVLLPDTSGTPTVVELGSLRITVIKRGQRTGIRVKDMNSAAARNYRGPVFYELNPEYRVIATWVPSDGKRTIDVPNVLGDTTSIPIAGEVHFRLKGQDEKLTDIGGHPEKGLFLVFNDLTTKTETYPGGRFLDTGPVVNGSVELDFNRAYNPPCAVTAYATCPLAPKENRLGIAITAGEKYDRGHAHH
jgi:uncharacterized protein